MSQWAIIYSKVIKYLKQTYSLPSKVGYGHGRLLLLFAVAVSITLSLSDNHVVADMLLQSPAPSPPPPAEPPPAPPPEQPPAEPAPPPEQPPVEPPPPAEPIPAQEQSTQQETTFQSPVSPIAPESPVLPAGSQPPPLPAPQSSQTEFQDDNPDESSSSDMVLDQVELVDTIIVSGAYIWLCCGIGLFLLIPLAFLFLQIRGQIKMRREDKF